MSGRTTVGRFVGAVRSSSPRLRTEATALAAVRAGHPATRPAAAPARATSGARPTAPVRESRQARCGCGCTPPERRPGVRCGTGPASQTREGLQGRVRGHQRFQVADDLQMPAERQSHLGTLDESGQAQLHQPGGLRGRPLLGHEVAERLASPQTQRVVVGPQVALLELTGCGSRGRVGSCRPNFVDEVEGIDLGRVDVGAIADAVTVTSSSTPSLQALGAASRPGSAGRSSGLPAGWPRTTAGRRAGWPGWSGPAPKQLDQQGAFGQPR